MHKMNNLFYNDILSCLPNKLSKQLMKTTDKKKYTSRTKQSKHNAVQQQKSLKRLGIFMFSAVFCRGGGGEVG